MIKKENNEMNMIDDIKEDIELRCENLSISNIYI